MKININKTLYEKTRFRANKVLLSNPATNGWGNPEPI